MRHVIALFLLCPLIRADVSYTTTTQITGGALVAMVSLPMVGDKMREALAPQKSQFLLKGDRLIQRFADSAQIIDLGAQTMTSIDFKARTYTVTTFAEFEARMEKAMSDLKKKKSDRQAEVDLSFDVKETGRTQTIDGHSCREVILLTKIHATDPQTGQSGEHTMRNAMWIAKNLPGEKEIHDFWLRMAAKMKFDPATMQAGGLPGFGAGIAELQKKARTLEGTAIVSTITAGGTGEPAPEEIPATTEAIRRADQENLDRIKAQGPSGKDVAGAATASAIGAAIPGFGGFGRKKKTEPPPAADAAPAADAGVTMKMRMTEHGFSTSAMDASAFEIPTGFQKVAAKE